MADIAKMIEEIKTMTVVELNDLVKAIEEEFGVSAAAPVAVVGGAAPAAAEAAEEKTEFKVTLKNAGGNKIAAIKAVREFTGLGLVEAKGLVEKLGVIKENATKEEAESGNRRRFQRNRRGSRCGIIFVNIKNAGQSLRVFRSAKARQGERVPPDGRKCP